MTNPIYRYLIFGMMFAGLGISGCAQDSSIVREAFLSPSELNTNSARYDGQDVIVRGYVTLEAEGHTLYESQRLNEEFRKRWSSGEGSFDPKDYMKYCLTIANPQLLYENRSAFAKKTVVVKGRFIQNYLDGKIIDLGACPLATAIVIDEDDLRRRYSLR